MSLRRRSVQVFRSSLASHFSHIQGSVTLSARVRVRYSMTLRAIMESWIHEKVWGLSIGCTRMEIFTTPPMVAARAGRTSVPLSGTPAMV